MTVRDLVSRFTDNRKQTLPEERTPEYVIRSTSGWSSLALHELWEYRELLWFLTMRDIKGRYRQMALGPLWIIIKPVFDMVIFSVVFGGLAKLPSDGIPYPIFTYTAILPWTYFQGAASTSVGSLVSRMSVISKVYFPRLVVPVSAVLSGLVDLGVAFLVLVGMMVYYGFAPSLVTLTLPLFVPLATATALGVGLWSATMAVRFRDLKNGHGSRTMWQLDKLTLKSMQTCAF